MPDIDLKKALLQHLESLRWSGLSDLPAAAELSFDLSHLQAAVPPTPDSSTPAASTTNPRQAVAASARATQTPTIPPPPTQTDGPRSTAAAALAPLDSPATDPTPTASAARLVGTGYGAPIVDIDARNEALSVVANEVGQCVKCPELCRNRTNTVFGTGPAKAQIVFLGEGPGATEDQRGQPFVGAAGKLLDKIIAASSLSRDQVYILNIVKCRPPGNRNPAESEIKNCWNYLERQLEIIQPTHIVCLGSVAAKSLLDTKASLGKMRKQFHAYRGSKVIVTYHPAYLLRTPAAKKHVWEDMKLLMAEFGVEL